MSWRRVSFSFWLLVGQLDLVNTEPLCPTTPAVLDWDAVGRVPGEVTVDHAGATARVVRVDDEADPADDVVHRVRSRALEQPVDREQELVSDMPVERSRERRVVERRTRHRVVLAGRQLVVLIPVRSE